MLVVLDSGKAEGEDSPCYLDRWEPNRGTDMGNDDLAWNHANCVAYCPQRLKIIVLIGEKFQILLLLAQEIATGGGFLRITSSMPDTYAFPVIAVTWFRVRSIRCRQACKYLRRFEASKSLRKYPKHAQELLMLVTDVNEVGSLQDTYRMKKSSFIKSFRSSDLPLR